MYRRPRIPAQDQPVTRQRPRRKRLVVMRAHPEMVLTCLCSHIPNSVSRSPTRQASCGVLGGCASFESEAPLGASPTFKRPHARRRVAKHHETRVRFHTPHLRHRTHGYIYTTLALQADRECGVNMETRVLRNTDSLTHSHFSPSRKNTCLHVFLLIYTSAP